jgi:hypothetical protein
MNTKQFLLSSNYWVINKNMLNELGLDATFILSALAEAENILADSDGWFYQTIETLENQTTLSRHKQEQAIKILKDKNILLCEIRGIPPKRHFKINYQNINFPICEKFANQYAKNSQINMRKIDKSICEKFATNKESNYKESNYKESNKEDTKKINYKQIVNSFNSICKSYPKVNKLSETRKKTIKARFNNGYDYQDFINLFEMAEQSEFLKGENNRSWQANFDWLIKDANFAKVLDGNYSNKKSKNIWELGEVKEVDIDNIF